MRPDHLGVVKPIYRLGEGVVVGTADAANGGLDACLGEAFRVFDRDVLGGFKQSSQHFDFEEVAMKMRKRYSDRCVRGRMRSPGRPRVARRENFRLFWGAISSSARVAPNVSSDAPRWSPREFSPRSANFPSPDETPKLLNYVISPWANISRTSGSIVHREMFRS